MVSSSYSFTILQGFVSTYFGVALGSMAKSFFIIKQGSCSKVCNFLVTYGHPLVFVYIVIMYLKESEGLIVCPTVAASKTELALFGIFVGAAYGWTDNQTKRVKKDFTYLPRYHENATKVQHTSSIVELYVMILLLILSLTYCKAALCAR